MKPDILVEVRFKTSDEGGRKSPVTGNIYGCPMFIDGEGFDCRLNLGGRTFILGEIYEVEVRFMNSDSVLSKLHPGKIFTLWEGKDIAKGKVLKLF